MTKQRRCPAITLGLPSTLFYPRASGLPNGFSVKEARHARKTTTPQVPPWGSPPRRRRVCRRCSPCPPQPPKTPARYSKTRFPLEAMSILGHSFRLKADPENASQSERSFRDAFSARGRSGKAIPLWSYNLGRAFRRHSAGSQHDKRRGPIPAIRGQALVLEQSYPALTSRQTRSA